MTPEQIPLFKPAATTGRPPFYKRKSTYVIAALLLLLFIWLGDSLHENVPPPPLGKPDASLLWLNHNYPAMMTHDEVQADYTTLMKGYSIPQTGLFLSFPGTTDLALIQQSATYDEGIAGVLLLAIGDTPSAGKIVQFYEKAWAKLSERQGPRKGRLGLANFYNAYYEVEGIEKTMHVGPNAWIGLLASRYYQETGDPKALQLALDIAHWILYRVPHSDGIVAMGEIPWNSAPWDKIFSTENNESTYAFLQDLLHAKNLSSRDRTDIEQECFHIRRWLLTRAYNPKTNKVIRGFHPGGVDHVGAIDSYTWYIGTLRPGVVRNYGTSIQKLMDRATHDFVVNLKDRWGVDPVDKGMADATYQDDVYNRKIGDPLYLRPEKNRHPVIWYEGTGQYIIGLQDAAVEEAEDAFHYPPGPERESHLAMAQKWLSEARLGLGWMDSAAMHLPWGKTYPCATDGRFYLYGWPAPRGTEHNPSDAVAALVWRMFAGIGFEPLSGTFLNPTFHPRVSVIKKKFHDPGTDLLYGASEEMVVRAWNLYEQKRFGLAYRQAQATINLWEKDAKALQKKKKEIEGGYLPYDGESMAQFQKVHNYWALNDVCAAYFIQGRIEHDRQNYPQAVKIFSTILKEFSLAQMWDKRGWFWDPVNTLQMEFAAGDPQHYGVLFDLLPPVADAPKPKSLTPKPINAQPPQPSAKPL